MVLKQGTLLQGPQPQPLRCPKLIASAMTEARQRPRDWAGEAQPVLTQRQQRRFWGWQRLVCRGGPAKWVTEQGYSQLEG